MTLDEKEWVRIMELPPRPPGPGVPYVVCDVCKGTGVLAEELMLQQGALTVTAQGHAPKTRLYIRDDSRPGEVLCVQVADGEWAVTATEPASKPEVSPVA